MVDLSHVESLYRMVSSKRVAEAWNEVIVPDCPGNVPRPPVWTERAAQGDYLRVELKDPVSLAVVLWQVSLEIYYDLMVSQHLEEVILLFL